MLRPGRKPYQRIRCKTGYVFVWVPWDDPYCPGKKRTSKRNKGAWAREHRYIVSKHIGRMLKPKESVHHLNAIRHDNRIENLELWSTSHQKGARRVDLVLEWLSENGWREVKKLLCRTKHKRRVLKPR